LDFLFCRFSAKFSYFFKNQFEHFLHPKNPKITENPDFRFYR